MSHAAGMMVGQAIQMLPEAVVRCPVCGGPSPKGGTGLLCSTACRTAAYRARKAGKPIPIPYMTGTCLVCGGETQPNCNGRPTRWCSAVCKTRWYRMDGRFEPNEPEAERQIRVARFGDGPAQHARHIQDLIGDLDIVVSRVRGSANQNRPSEVRELLDEAIDQVDAIGQALIVARLEAA